jgi:hypothetical protein
MKYIITILIFITYTFYGQNHKLICVLNEKSIKNNMFVEVEFKNHTKINYCLVIDTLYLINRFAQEKSFQSPFLFLENKKRKNIDTFTIKQTCAMIDTIFNQKDLFRTKQVGDTLLVNKRVILKNLFKNGYKSSLNIFKIKAKSSLKLKIPFNLFLKYIEDGELKYYDINTKEKYFGRVKYMIKSEYIEKYIPQQKIDSLNNKGYKFFTGKLISNKVPLIFDK